jgi:uncharacterized cupredoxin-like copper-binding protein
MARHRIHPNALIAIVIALALVALLAAACGGGNSADSETAAATATAEEMEPHGEAVAATPTEEHDEHDEAVDEHTGSIDEHDEAVDEHADADDHGEDVVTAAPGADHDEHDDVIDDHAEGEGDAHEADMAHMEIDEHEARTITVIASDFAYESAEIHATVGETIRLVLVNEGTVLHDITAVGFTGDASAVSTVEHDHGEASAMDFHTAAETGETTELLFVATEAGEFKLFCTVPGHELLGMTGVLIVDEA